MNPEIVELSNLLDTLYKKLMAANPWDEGYGEVSAIHLELLQVLRDRAQLDFKQFTEYLEAAAKDIEDKWTSSKPALKPWLDTLGPVFKKVEILISYAVPLLKLLI